MIPQSQFESDPPNSNRGVRRTFCNTFRQEDRENRGVRTAVKIDWLAVTFHPNRNDMTKLYPTDLRHDWFDCPPVKGYTAGRQFIDGRRENVNTNRDDMGTHVIYSGQCLNRISEETGIDGLELLRHYVTHSAKITRLDIAVDAHDSRINLDSLKSLFDAGKAATRAKECNLILGSGLHPGKTLYIGSRSSEAFLRCYDKAAEQKQNADWLRFEMELKGSKAAQIGALLAKARNPYTLIQSIIRGHCDFQDETYKAVMTIEPTIVARAKDTAADTKKWLLNTCAPALARQIVQHGDKHLLHQFLTVVADEIAALESGLSDVNASLETLLKDRTLSKREGEV